MPVRWTHYQKEKNDPKKQNNVVQPPQVVRREVVQPQPAQPTQQQLPNINEEVIEIPPDTEIEETENEEIVENEENLVVQETERTLQREGNRSILEKIEAIKKRTEEILKSFELGLVDIQKLVNEMFQVKKLICECRVDETRIPNVRKFILTRRNLEKAQKNLKQVVKHAQDIVNRIEEKQFQNLEWEIQKLKEVIVKYSLVG